MILNYFVRESRWHNCWLPQTVKRHSADPTGVVFRIPSPYRHRVPAANVYSGEFGVVGVCLRGGQIVQQIILMRTVQRIVTSITRPGLRTRKHYITSQNLPRSTIENAGPNGDYKIFRRSTKVPDVSRGIAVTLLLAKATIFYY